MVKRNAPKSPQAIAETAATNPGLVLKTPARTVGFELGTVWLIGESRVTIQYLASVHEVIVRFHGTGRTEKVPIGELRAPPLTDAENLAPYRQQSVQEYSEQAWRRARAEYREIKALVDEGKLGRADRAKAAKRLRISDRQLLRKISRFDSLGTAAACLPRRTGPVTGSTTLHPDLEDLIKQQITDALKTSPDIGVDDMHELIVDAVTHTKLRPPGRATVSRRLARLRADPDLLPTPIGDELRKRKKISRGPHRAEGPLHIVEIDHTVVDVHIVDPIYRRPIGRPVWTVAIDVDTRVITGSLLSLEAPSRLSVALCMHHAVMPKHEWLQSLGIPEACWPGYGLMRQLRSDNAAEFRAPSLRRAAELYNVELTYRRIGEPADGAIVERAIGTFVTKLRLLPGSSFSKLLKAAPRHAQRLAKFTLAELNLYLAREISRYHKHKHDGLGMPPATAWEQRWIVNGVPASPRVPDSADKFLINFLPGSWRTVTREGIEIFTRRYQSSDLASLVRPLFKRMVRYDPRRISRVFVETNDHHVVAYDVDISVPDMSLWEWNAIKAQLVAQGRSRDVGVSAAELVANRQMIADKARSSVGLRDGRLHARHEEWKKVQDVAKNAVPLLTSTRAVAPVCLVEDIV